MAEKDEKEKNPKFPPGLTPTVPVAEGGPTKTAALEAKEKGEEPPEKKPGELPHDHDMQLVDVVKQHGTMLAAFACQVDGCKKVQTGGEALPVAVQAFIKGGPYKTSTGACVLCDFLPKEARLLDFPDNHKPACKWRLVAIASR